MMEKKVKGTKKRERKTGKKERKGEERGWLWAAGHRQDAGGAVAPEEEGWRGR